MLRSVPELAPVAEVTWRSHGGCTVVAWRPHGGCEGPSQQSRGALGSAEELGGCAAATHGDSGVHLNLGLSAVPRKSTSG